MLKKIRDLAPITIHDEIVELARKGDTLAREHLQQLIDAIETVLIGLINSYDPHYGHLRFLLIT